MHYGDITMTFLNNWFKADRRGTSLTYASAVAIEEKSVVDYNKGTPDGVLSPGEKPRVPKVPLVSIYPSEGTLYSDSPFYVLDAQWVDADERAGAELFGEFVQQPENQSKVLEYGFRPANPAVKVADPIVKANGVDPDQPATLLDVPQPSVMIDLLDAWAKNRKTARVLMVLDVSGSMGQPADGNDGDSKLDLAKEAAIDALDQFNPEDEVGLRVFTTNMGPGQDEEFQDLQPIAPIGANRERLAESIRNLVPQNATALLGGAGVVTDVPVYDPTRINAIIPPHRQGQRRQPRGRPAAAGSNRDPQGSSGELSQPIRMFTVAYGARTGALSLIAGVVGRRLQQDATTIAKVFTGW